MTFSSTPTNGCGTSPAPRSALPGGGERLRRRSDRATRAVAAEDLRRDQGPHQGDRPVGPGSAGRLVVLRAQLRGQAVRRPLPLPVADRATGTRRCWRSTSRFRASRSCSTATWRPRATTSSRSARLASAPTATCWPTRSTSSATSGTCCGSRTCAPASSICRRDRRHGAGATWSPKPHRLLRHGRRGLAARHRVAAPARHAGRRRAGLPRARRAVLAGRGATRSDKYC